MGPNEMRKPRLPLDRSTADRLAGGDLHPSDAPPGYERVAEVLFEAGRTPAIGLDTQVDARLLGDLVLAIGTSTEGSRGRTVLTERITAKVAALAAVTVLSATGAAAAATGNLPGPAQDAVAGVADAVGIDVPRSGDDDAEQVEVDAVTDPSAPGADEDDDGTTSTTAGGATAAHAGNPTDADDHGAAVSETARTTEATGRDKGAAVSEEARRNGGGNGQNGNGNGNGGGTTSTTIDDDTTSTTVDDDTTSTTVDDDDDDDRGSSGRGPGGSGSDDDRSGPNRGRG